MAAQPAQLDEHQKDYKAGAWEMYTIAELGWWVHLFTTRARHRDNPEKRAKDIHDARNYLAMITAKVDAAEAE